MAHSRPAGRRYELALWVDRRVGPALCALLLAARNLFRRRRDPSPDPVRKVLLLKFWGMGSIVLATPLLERLRARHPQARVDFVTLRENAALLALVPGVGRVVALDLSRGTLRFLVETGRTLEENGLEAVEEVASSSARLIVNRASYHARRAEVAKLLESLAP